MGPCQSTLKTPKVDTISGYFFIVLLGFMTVSCPSVQDIYAKNSDGSLGDEFDTSISMGTDEKKVLLEGEKIDGEGVDPPNSNLREDSRLGKVIPLQQDPLAEFFSSIAQSQKEGKESVRILHYGDSHTAADFLTTAIRRSLQDRFGDGGRGFVLLGRPWNSYRPKDVYVDPDGRWTVERIKIAADAAKLDGYYGLSGISVTADQASAKTLVSTETGTGYGQKASVFEVFYLGQPGGGSFNVLVDGVSKGTVDTNSKKKRSGFFKVTVDEGAHNFVVKLKGNGPVRFFGAVIENDGPGIVYDTLGVNGGFFYTPQRWNPEELKKQIARRSPKLIVTMYGSNEVDSKSIDPTSYKAHVKMTMSRFRAGAPEASCLMLGPPDRIPRLVRVGQPDQLAWIIEVQREVASEIGCAFLDLQEMMGGPGSHQTWQYMRPNLAQPDGVHLTVKGYRVLGEKIADELIAAYEEYTAGL